MEAVTSVEAYIPKTYRIAVLGFYIFTTVATKSTIFLDVLKYSLLKVYRRFGGIYCHRLQLKIIGLASSPLHAASQCTFLRKVTRLLPNYTASHPRMSTRLVRKWLPLPWPPVQKSGMYDLGTARLRDELSDVKTPQTLESVIVRNHALTQSSSPKLTVVTLVKRILKVPSSSLAQNICQPAVCVALASLSCHMLEEGQNRYRTHLCQVLPFDVTVRAASSLVETTAPLSLAVLVE